MESCKVLSILGSLSVGFLSFLGTLLYWHERFHLRSPTAPHICAFGSSAFDEFLWLLSKSEQLLLLVSQHGYLLVFLLQKGCDDIILPQPTSKGRHSRFQAAYFQGDLHSRLIPCFGKAYPLLFHQCTIQPLGQYHSNRPADNAAEGMELERISIHLAAMEGWVCWLL